MLMLVAAGLVGAWAERLVGALPAMLQTFADFALPLATALMVMLAFRDAARRQVMRRRVAAEAREAREASTRADGARAPGSSGTR